MREKAMNRHLEEDGFPFFAVVLSFIFLFLLLTTPAKHIFDSPKAQFVKTDLAGKKLFASLRLPYPPLGLQMNLATIGGEKRIAIATVLASLDGTENRIGVYVFRPNSSLANSPGPTYLPTFGSGISPFASVAIGGVNGQRRIVVKGSNGPGTETYVYVLDGDARLINAFRYTTPSGNTYSELVIDDLNNDGQTEFIFTSSQDLYVVNAADGSVRQGFPQTIVPLGVGRGLSKESPGIADINGDGVREIFIAGNHYIFGFSYAGAFLPGYPITSPTINENRGSPPLYSSPAASKNLERVFDRGNADEVIVTESGYFPELYGGQATLVHHLNANGYVSTSFPKIILNSYQYSSPVTLGDINEDGNTEIVIWHGEVRSSRRSWIRVLASSGEDFPGWPLSIEEREIHAFPLVADINSDGRHELAFLKEGPYRENSDECDYSSTYSTELDVRDARGNIVPGFPVEYRGYSDQLLFGDLGDRKPKLFLAGFSSGPDQNLDCEPDYIELDILSFFGGRYRETGTYTNQSWPMSSNNPMRTGKIER